jgi:uncharacterized protein with PIN domain
LSPCITFTVNTGKPDSGGIATGGMYQVTIRFYEELNDFLPRHLRKGDIEFSFSGRRSIKDLIEHFGVPHVEVDLILVDGRSVDFGYIVKSGDRISVYPVFESFSVDGLTRLRPSPLRDTRFVLDVHLRKLARRLRLLGFDVDYRAGRDDPELARVAQDENRILLTRDRRLLMRRNVSRGIIIRSTDPDRQIVEVLERLQLWSRCRPWTRCIECNGMLRGLDTLGGEFEALRERIPPGVLSWCGEYYLCGSCGKIYWKGSHYEKLKRIVERIMTDRSEEPRGERHPS